MGSCRCGFGGFHPHHRAVHVCLARHNISYIAGQETVEPRNLLQPPYSPPPLLPSSTDQPSGRRCTSGLSSHVDLSTISQTFAVTPTTGFSCNQRCEVGYILVGQLHQQRLTRRMSGAHEGYILAVKTPHR